MAFMRMLLCAEFMVSTARNRTSARIMRSYAACACSSGNVSIIGRTFCSRANASVSSLSATVPVNAPTTERPPNTRSTAFTAIGSPGTATTISLPRADSPATVSAMPEPVGAVPSTTFAPPSARSTAATSRSAHRCSDARRAARQARPCRSAGDRDGMKPHLVRELHREMAGPPRPWTATTSPARAPALRSALNVVAPRTTAARPRPHRDRPARARPASFGQHDFRVAAVRRHPGDDRVLAVHDVAVAARPARAILAGEKAHTDPLAEPPAGHPFAQRVDSADDFMPRYARRRASGASRSTVALSEWHTPQASTRMRTCPCVGAGIGRSTSSSCPGALTTAAR